MKKLFLCLSICFLMIACSSQPKKIIKLSQRVFVEHVDYLGNGQYEVYFSYKWRDGHMIGTGITTNYQVNVGDIKTYIEYEKENKNGQIEPGRDLQD